MTLAADAGEPVWALPLNFVGSGGLEPDARAPFLGPLGRELLGGRCTCVVGAVKKPSAAWGQDAAKYKKESRSRGNIQTGRGCKDRSRSVLGGLLYISKDPGLFRRCLLKFPIIPKMKNYSVV